MILQVSRRGRRGRHSLARSALLVVVLLSVAGPARAQSPSLSLNPVLSSNPGLAANPGLSLNPGLAAKPGVAVREPEVVWNWPLTAEPPVVRRFQIGPAPWSPGHRGADLAAVIGQPIRAPVAGVVRFAGPVAGRPVLSLDAGAGLIASLEPVNATVRAGQRVAAGDVIGVLSGVPGHCAPRPCLHWGVRAAGRYIDPLELVHWTPPVIILLPVLGEQNSFAIE